jgi:hypothetical protein
MKLRYAAFAAALAVATFSVGSVAAPTSAEAQTVVVKKVYRDGGPRAHMRMHRHHDRHMHRARMHRGADKVVIVKKRRY